MLTYRTQILFDTETMQVLKSLSKKYKITVGKLVRTAVKQSYLPSQPYSKRIKAWETILRTRPKQSIESIDYKDLISYGRNF